jgi:DNA-binding CsgD family transcriptional regulator
MLANCYQQNGNTDSAAWYATFFKQKDDSINLLINRANIGFIRLKLDYENKEQEAELLQIEKKSEILKRNVLLVSLLVLAGLAILLYNRQRLKTKLHQQQKALAQADAHAAKKELTIFTQLLLDKNEQIEKLNESLNQQQQINTDELVHQTLLTDYDWNQFKELFEKTSPGYFNRLKNTAPGITAAEMRLAALIKLNMDNKQMASMQGVSLGTIRVTKSRLRQKLNIAADDAFENFIKSI